MEISGRQAACERPWLLDGEPFVKHFYLQIWAFDCESTRGREEMLFWRLQKQKNCCRKPLLVPGIWLAGTAA